MHICFSSTRTLIGLATTTFLAGCVALPGILPHNELPGLPAKPRDVKSEKAAAAELRISGDILVQAEEIPLVPVPPIPHGTGTGQRPLPPLIPDMKPVSAPPTPAPRPTNSAVPPDLAPPLPTPPAVTPTATPTPRPMNSDMSDLKQIVGKAYESYGKVDSYITRLTRRENANGKTKPEEILLFKFRKEPWSIYFKWLGNEGKGREVVYVKDHHENKIHTLLAAGDVPLVPAGKRMALSPDSLLVKAASRHPISEAGIGANIDRLAGLLASVERGDKTRGTLTDQGVQNRPDYGSPLRLVMHDIPAGIETELPRGGKRLYGFDTESNLPVLLITYDDKEKEIEYYRYDKMQLAIKLDDRDFHPDLLWVPTPKPAQVKP